MTTTKRLQREPLKEYPMRPVALTLDLDSAHAVAVDAAPVDWGVAGTRIGDGGTLNVASKTMDDNNKATITTGDVTVDLDPGIYEVRVNLHIIEGGGANELVTVAITNLDGSTIFHVSDQIDLRSSNDIFYRATQVCSITAVSDGIAVRAVLETAGTVTIAPAQVAFIKKVGNDGEA
jgi:hypothetical protein